VPAQVKTFNLQESKVIRDLNPADINCLISVSGMVTRTSAVIPDLTCACLRDLLQCPLPVFCCSLPGKGIRLLGQPGCSWRQVQQAQTYHRHMGSRSSSLVVRPSLLGAQGGDVWVRVVRDGEAGGGGVRAAGGAPALRPVQQELDHEAAAQPLLVSEQAAHQDAGVVAAPSNINNTLTRVAFALFSVI
jgi:MCM OB domain